MSDQNEVKPRKKGGAPKGNKFGGGYGRPVTDFDNQECVEMGKELLAWLKEKIKKNEPVYHLSDWYFMEKNLLKVQWAAISQRECFLTYMEQARELMSVCIIRNEKLAQSYGNRFLHVYSAELREVEKKIREEEIDYNIEKKLEADRKMNVSPNDAKLDEIIETLKKK